MTAGATQLLSIHHGTQVAPPVQGAHAAMPLHEFHMMPGDLKRLFIGYGQMVVGERIIAPAPDEKGQPLNNKRVLRKGADGLGRETLQRGRDPFSRGLRVDGRYDQIQAMVFPHLLKFKDRGMALSQTLKKDLEDLNDRIRVGLKVGEEITPVAFPNNGVFHGRDCCTAGLFLDHAHFTENFTDADKGQVDLSSLQVLTNLNLPLFDNKGALPQVAFLEDNVSGLVFEQFCHEILNRCGQPFGGTYSIGHPIWQKRCIWKKIIFTLKIRF